MTTRTTQLVGGAIVAGVTVQGLYTSPSGTTGLVKSLFHFNGSAAVQTCFLGVGPITGGGVLVRNWTTPNGQGHPEDLLFVVVPAGQVLWLGFLVATLAGASIEVGGARLFGVAP